MVLATNERLNNLENDQKCANASTTTTENSSSTSTISITTAINNADQMEENQQQQLQQQQDLSSIINSNSLKLENMMAENDITSTASTTAKTPATVSEVVAVTLATITTANENFKDEQFTDEKQVEKIDDKAMSLNEKAEFEDNNQKPQKKFESDANDDGYDDDDKTAHANCNSNTNTLQGPAPTTSSNNTNANNNMAVHASKSLPILLDQDDQTSPPLHCPITSQALSNALQSVMQSATYNANSSSTNINLQNNFLSSLAIDISANVGLQQTAKQLSASFASCCTNITGAGETASASATSSSCVSTKRDEQQVNGPAKVMLLCESNSHPFQTRTIPLTPNIECKVGRLIAKSKATDTNAIFDCKVLSRNHAVLWYSDDGKFWVKDTKSSNGTFINDNKLGNEAAELHFDDVVKFGVDVLENSRKEVHGCIIAMVKLFLPDGREAISIDGSHTQRQHDEGYISYDELQRLNLYMQEMSQRERALKSKLFNIQNVLDATRKNSANCWKAMITEDQLLHHIRTLEKKLQLMDKNMPENILRNHVTRLLQDKDTYQYTAKEALRKVYQERCDAMQKLSKMEAAFTASDSECQILREQISDANKSLQDVNVKLQRLQIEYNEFKVETQRQQQEAKEKEEQHIVHLTGQLSDRHSECEELKSRIASLRSEMLNDVEQMAEVNELAALRRELFDTKEKEKASGDGSGAVLPPDEEQMLQSQAIEKLEAAIAGMDIGGDDDDDDDDDDDEDIVVDLLADANANRNIHYNSNDAGLLSLNDKEKYDTHEVKELDDDETNRQNITDVAMATSNKSKKNNLNRKELYYSPKSSTNKQVTEYENTNSGVKESTIMKWLQNSDLNRKEGSLDIFKAICNESDSSDEQDTSSTAGTAGGRCSDGVNKLNVSTEDFEKKLENVQRNLKKIEAEIAREAEIAEKAVAKLAVDAKNGKGPKITAYDDGDEDDDDSDNDVEMEVCIGEATNEFRSSTQGRAKRNDVAKANSVLLKGNENYSLLKDSVHMLRDVYNEIRSNMQQLQSKKEVSKAIAIKQKRQQKQQMIQKTTVCSTVSNTKKFESQETLTPLLEVHQEEEEEDYNDDDDDYDDDDADDDGDTISEAATTRPSKKAASPSSSASSSSASTSSPSSMEPQQHIENDNDIRKYKQQIANLNNKYEELESDSQNTLELMQIECESYKDKVNELTVLIETLRDQKDRLEQRITHSENIKSNGKVEVCDDGFATTAKPPAVLRTTTTTKTVLGLEQVIEKTIATTTNTIQQHENNKSSADELDEDDADAEQENLDLLHAFQVEARKELSMLNNRETMRENELMEYKEILEQSENENIRLREEISKFKEKAHSYFIQTVLPFGVVVMAIIVYFLTTYF